MRINQYIALLDACVAAPMPISDTLLRLAEEPAFYAPRWSEQILAETEHALIKLGCSECQAQRRLQVMRDAFPEAIVVGYEALINVMTNNKTDRHVLAAAIVGGAHTIVSDNKKHFPTEALKPYGLECLTADQFIEHQYHLNPDVFINKLIEQAQDINFTLPQLISRHVPSLARLIST